MNETCISSYFKTFTSQENALSESCKVVKTSVPRTSCVLHKLNKRAQMQTGAYSWVGKIS